MFDEIREQFAINFKDEFANRVSRLAVEIRI